MPGLFSPYTGIFPAHFSAHGCCTPRGLSPLWIVKKWLAVYPEETVERLLAAFLEPASTYIRCNSSRISPEALLNMIQ